MCSRILMVCDRSSLKCYQLLNQGLCVNIYWTYLVLFFPCCSTLEQIFSHVIVHVPRRIVIASKLSQNKIKYIHKPHVYRRVLSYEQLYFLYKWMKLIKHVCFCFVYTYMWHILRTLIQYEYHSLKQSIDIKRTNSRWLNYVISRCYASFQWYLVRFIM